MAGTPTPDILRQGAYRGAPDEMGLQDPSVSTFRNALNVMKARQKGVQTNPYAALAALAPLAIGAVTSPGNIAGKAAEVGAPAVSGLKKFMSNMYESDILGAMAKKAPLAGEAFLEKFGPNIGKLLRPWRGAMNAEGLKDLEQEAKIATLKAFEQWNKTDKSIPFHAYLVPHVKKSIAEYVRKQGPDIGLPQRFTRDISRVRKAEKAFPYEVGPEYAKGAPIEKVPPPGTLETSLLSGVPPKRVERVQRKLYPTERTSVSPITGAIPTGGATLIKHGPRSAEKQIVPEQLVSKPASLSGETENFINSLKLPDVVKQSLIRSLHGETQAEIAKALGGSQQLADQRIKQAIAAARRAMLRMENMPRGK